MSCKKIPEGANQNITDAPYSLVLEVECNKLVVISGQVSTNMEGKIVGDTIEEQTKFTMENCKKQLGKAGCTLDDVFKVNVYLTDLDLWEKFNGVYITYFEKPLPVRTTVQTGLLYTYLLEIEMWAAKK